MKLPSGRRVRRLFCVTTFLLCCVVVLEVMWTDLETSKIFRTLYAKKDAHKISYVKSLFGAEISGDLMRKALSVNPDESPAAASDKGSSHLPSCSELQVKLEGLNVTVNTSQITYLDLKKELAPLLQAGGHYSPADCESRDRTAIIIPYRDRLANLLILLHNLVPFLVRQRIHFRIFVVEQTSGHPFNRCVLFNIGFVESLKVDNFTCFFMHDTDLIPRHLDTLYHCHPQRPRHFVWDRSNKGYRGLPYKEYTGGVLAMRREQVQKINGCSNKYYGWGSEDDDLYKRFTARNMTPVRYDNHVLGEYFGLGHTEQKRNKQRVHLVTNATLRMDQDGLNSLNYTVHDFLERELFTWILVGVPPPPPPPPPKRARADRNVAKPVKKK